MYAIYDDIGGILMVNVTIYSIHGSYGYIHLYSSGILRTSIFMRIFAVCCKSISSVAGTSQTALIQRYGLSCVQRVQNLKLLEISNNMNTQLEYS